MTASNTVLPIIPGGRPPVLFANSLRSPSSLFSRVTLALVVYVLLLYRSNAKVGSFSAPQIDLELTR